FWALFLAYLLTLAILFGSMIAATVVGGLLAVILGPVAAITLLIVVPAAMYVLVRLVFLQAPLAVAEGRKVVGRSWALSKGNFWRIFGILAAIFIPLIIVQVILQVTLF